MEEIYISIQLSIKLNEFFLGEYIGYSPLLGPIANRIRLLYVQISGGRTKGERRQFQWVLIQSNRPQSHSLARIKISSTQKILSSVKDFKSSE